jgi:hypothetical protein
MKTGVVAMNSEQMRNELEIFVNKGLREGWRGWPLKSEIQEGRSCGNRLNVTSLRIWRGGRSKPASPVGRLALFALSA